MNQITYIAATCEAYRRLPRWCGHMEATLVRVLHAEDVDADERLFHATNDAERYAVAGWLRRN